MKDNKGKRPGKHQQEDDDDAELFRKFLEQDKVPDKDKNRVRSKLPQAIKKTDVAELIHLDLHGLNLSEALAEVDRLFSKVTAGVKFEQRVRIITGKGRHSTTGEGVLVRSVYDHVKRQWSAFIKRIDSPPADDLIEGLPLRGHFDVLLSRR